MKQNRNNPVRDKNPVVSVTLICIASILICAVSGEPTDRSDSRIHFTEPGPGVSGSESEDLMNTLISLLRLSGLDISYGDSNETIFSMVDESLTRIIMDLSSGNADNFRDVPLITETMNYFGISPDEIIVHPEQEPVLREAIGAYNRKYPGDPE